MLFDQFKVEQPNSLKSVVTGLDSGLKDVRQENLDLKLPLSATEGKSRFLEDRLSKCSVPPTVNSHTVNSHTVNSHTVNSHTVNSHTECWRTTTTGLHRN